MSASRRTSVGNLGLPGSYLANPYGLPAMIDRNASDLPFAAGRSCLALLFLAFAAHGQEAPAPTVQARKPVPIHALRGDGSSSYEGKSVLLTGIVTATISGGGGRSGFHVQASDLQGDRDSSTSEGIRVRTGKGAPVVAAGDSVQVEGVVNRRGGALGITGASVRVLESGRPLPRPVALRLPFGTLEDPDRFEGMRVQLPQTLVVTGNAGWARSGSYAVSPARLLSPTQVASPGPQAQAARKRDSLARLLVYDDFGWQECEGVSTPRIGLAGRAPLRTGSRVSGLEGILEKRHGTWALRLTRSPVILEGNPRSVLPPAKPGSVRVASFNVHNYFTTRGAVRSCGPTRRKACRGVDDTGEFRNQKAKILAALQALDADIVGLMEIENHATDSALIDLVQGLNAASGAVAWERILTGPLGADAVKVAMIHRKGRVVPVGDASSLTRSQDLDFADRQHRVPLAQSFRHSGSGSVFTVVVNHLKSKGSPCPGDPDRGDGQGNCNAVRTLGAEALSRWVEGRPTGAASGETLLIGDFNAYAKEDPIVRLGRRGWVNLVARDQGDSAYSYQYGDAFGTLDYALATPKLAKRARAFTWAINADEPRMSSSPPDAYGSSDHDPVVVDLDLSDH